MIILKIYLVFCFLVATIYTILYKFYFMPDVVKNAGKLEKIRVYVMLFGSVFLASPYCLYEMIKTKINGGFKK